MYCVRIQVTKFKGILDNATRADSIVKEKYQSNKEAITLLGKPEPEINAALPAAGAQAADASLSPVCVEYVHKLAHSCNCSLS